MKYEETSITGSGGGGKGGSQSRPPVEAPNSLQSVAFVKIIDLISEGEIEGFVNATASEEFKDVYLDETPVANAVNDWNFSDLTGEIRKGTSNQDYLSEKFGSAGTVVAVDTEVSIDGGAVTRTITSATVDAVKILITTPSLADQNMTTGDINPTSVTLQLDIQPDGGSFTKIRDIVISGKCTSAYQRTINIPDLSEYGNAPYNIRLIRITADSDRASLRNTTYWTNYTELIYEKLYYPNSALIGLEVRADQFSRIPGRLYHIKGIKVQIPNNYNPVTREYSGVWNGNFAAAKAYTDNPAWILYDLLRSKRYGYGLEESQIDKASFYSASVYNDGMVPDGYDDDEPRFTFNTQIMVSEESYTVASLIASTMRAQIYPSSGKIYLTQDRPVDPIISVDNSNVENGNFTYTSSSRKNRHTQVAVSWNDPTDFYKQSVEYVDDNTGITRYGLRSVSTVAFACTSRGQAVRWGRWLLDTELNQTESVAYVTGLDHAGVVPGDVVSITDEFYSAAKFGGRVVNATTNSITLDQAVTLSGGVTYEIQVTLPNLTIEKKAITTGAGTHTQLSITGTFTSTPNKESVWQIIASNLTPRQFRVVNIKEIDGYKFNVEAVIHDPNKYARVEDLVDFDPPIHTRLPDSNVLSPPSGIDAEEFQSTEGQNRLFNVILSWIHSPDSRRMNYDVQWRKNPFPYEEYRRTASNSIIFNNVTQGLYFFRVRTLGLTGRSPWVTLDNFTVFADTTSTVDITGLQVVGGGTVFDGQDLEFEWDEVTHQPNLKDYKIQIMDPDNDDILRHMFTTTPSAIYTYGMNLEDGGPRRSLKVRVWARDVYDSISENPAVATFSNPAPDMSAVIPTVTARGGYLLVTWPNVPDNDMDYYEFIVDSTPINEIAYPGNLHRYFDVTHGTVYDFQIRPYDLFGAGVISQVGDGTPNKFPTEMIDIELAQSIIMTDSIDSTALALIELYDNILNSGGIEYPTGSDHWIEYDFSIEYFINAIQIWTNENFTYPVPAEYMHMWFEIERADGSKRFFAGDAGHQLVFENDQNRLSEYSTVGAAKTNYWQKKITEINNEFIYAFFTNGLSAKKCTLHFNCDDPITIYELIFRRIVIAEDIAVNTLSAITANVGTLWAGSIQSSDYGFDRGFEIDMTNKTINLGGSTEPVLEFKRVDNVNLLDINAAVTFRSGSTGYGNINDKPASLTDINATEFGWIDDPAAHINTKVTTIAGGKITTGSITASQIGASQITALLIGTNEIIAHTANIKNAVVTEAKIANASITNAKIGTAAITNAKIQDLSVSTLKIQGNAVTIPVSASSYIADKIPRDSIARELIFAVINTGGFPILIQANFVVRANSMFGDTVFFGYTYAIHKNSVAIPETSNGVWTKEDNHINLIWTDKNPGNGNQRYSLYITIYTSGPGQYNYVSQKHLMLLGVKR